VLKSPIITVCLSVCIAYNTDHKQGATKLLKLVNNCFLMVTFEKSKNYSIQSEKHNLHSTGIELHPVSKKTVPTYFLLLVCQI